MFAHLIWSEKISERKAASHKSSSCFPYIVALSMSWKSVSCSTGIHYAFPQLDAFSNVTKITKYEKMFKHILQITVHWPLIGEKIQYFSKYKRKNTGNKAAIKKYQFDRRIHLGYESSFSARTSKSWFSPGFSASFKDSATGTPCIHLSCYLALWCDTDSTTFSRYVLAIY